MKTWKLLAASIGVCVAVEGPAFAYYTIFPKWDSAPAVVARGVVLTTKGVDPTTVIFGRRNGKIATLARKNDAWWYGPTETLSFTIPGGIIDDPAAVYARDATVDPRRILTCMHEAAPPRRFYCTLGSVFYSADETKSITYDAENGPSPVLDGSFPPFSSPVLVRSGSLVHLFGLAGDGQIWYAAVDLTPGMGVNWYGWWSVPGTPAGGFAGDPEGAQLNDSGDIEICARAITGTRHMCNIQRAGIGWTGWFEVPAEQLGYSTSKKVMVRAGDAIWRVSRFIFDDSRMYASSSADGSVPWSLPTQIGFASQFLSAPGVAASTIGPTVLTVGRGNDSEFYFTTIGETNWSRIEARATN
jgi:hypothetical protein